MLEAQGSVSPRRGEGWGPAYSCGEGRGVRPGPQALASEGWTTPSMPHGTHCSLKGIQTPRVGNT